MMGYWGEAMTYNHPLWSQQDTEAGRCAVAKIKDSAKLSARERGFIEAIRKLYGEDDKPARDQAYSLAMEKLYKSNPDDLEAASFYALSQLGLVRPGDNGFRRQMVAGAIALDVYKKRATVRMLENLGLGHGVRMNPTMSGGVSGFVQDQA